MLINDLRYLTKEISLGRLLSGDISLDCVAFVLGVAVILEVRRSALRKRRAPDTFIDQSLETICLWD